MVAKLSPHWINYHGLGLDSIRPYAADWVKVVDPDPEQCRRIKEELGAKILARLSWLSSYNYGVAAKEVARQHARVMRDHPAWPDVDAWESLNEPGDLLSRATQGWLVDYWLELMRLVEDGGRTLVWGNFSNGAPPGKGNEGEPNWKPYKAVLERSGDRHILGLHEYWGPGDVLDSRPWWVGRFEFLKEKVRIMITECGFNYGVRTHAVEEIGFRECMTEEDYVAALGGYLALVQGDVRVEAAFVFTHDYASAEWASFDVSSIADRIGWLNSLGEMPEPVEPAPQEPQPGEPDFRMDLKTQLNRIREALYSVEDEVHYVLNVLDQIENSGR